ncbi:hypothetical protein HD599_002549 [Conyzicola lurida]|uniref:Methyltransferase family protein n=1 Tax=Conyzicola lurida TaxID=1172621 RepID=A0A841ARA7_9MICO|nr:class I SAM-dependent methyltransferase [Conyzicola lurida]MBB5844226.1 hypothetical protein [Conyzicola lurida]
MNARADYPGLQEVVIGDDLTPWVSAESYWHPRRIVLSAWLEHAPFAFWITNALKPSTFVELGTHNGFSFYTFCEAARRLRLPLRAYALDTWQGDDHAGFYGEEIFADVDAVRAEQYPDMAVLLRGYFEESVDKFDDGSVDLLHIDGRHGYEDVKEDFESWLPKVADHGIVLFHDIAEHENGFAVWQLWDELTATYPSFTFHHGHGLGVLSVGTVIPEPLRALFDATDEEADAIRAFYSDQGQIITERYLKYLEIANLRAEIDALNAKSAELETRLDATVQHVNAQLGEMAGSYSWRLTSPLRRVVARVPAPARRTLRAGARRVLRVFRR